MLLSAVIRKFFVIFVLYAVCAFLFSPLCRRRDESCFAIFLFRRPKQFFASVPDFNAKAWKNCHRQLFLTPFALLGFKSLWFNKKIHTADAMCIFYAEGGTWTRTTVGHYPLKIACLPIPPLLRATELLYHLYFILSTPFFKICMNFNKKNIAWNRFFVL